MIDRCSGRSPDWQIIAGASPSQTEMFSGYWMAGSLPTVAGAVPFHGPASKVPDHWIPSCIHHSEYMFLRNQSCGNVADFVAAVTGPLDECASFLCSCPLQIPFPFSAFVTCIKSKAFCKTCAFPCSPGASTHRRHLKTCVNSKRPISQAVAACWRLSILDKAFRQQLHAVSMTADFRS